MKSFLSSEEDALGSEETTAMASSSPGLLRLELRGRKQWCAWT